MVRTYLTFNNTFTTDGIFECLLVIKSDIDLYTETWTFTVQYALENLYFGLWENSSFSNFSVLEAPLYSKNMTFSLLSDVGQPLATNVSWTLDFGNSEIYESDRFIQPSDQLTGVGAPTYSHVMSQYLVFTEAGDFTATLSLKNLISNMTLTFNYRIYNQISGLEITDILHQVNSMSIQPSIPVFTFS